MSDITSDTIGGFNQFLKEQRALRGDAVLTLVQFSTDYQAHYTAMKLQDVRDLGPDTYVPDGMSTRYLDAMARVINETGRRLAKLPEADRPNKVMVVTMTDGLENDSREFSTVSGGKGKIKGMIEHQEGKYAWKFVFLGADMDAVGEATSIGTQAGRSMTFAKSGDGVQAAFCSLSSMTQSFRSAAPEDADKALNFKASDRSAQQDLGAHDESSTASPQA